MKGDGNKRLMKNGNQKKIENNGKILENCKNKKCII